MTRTGTIRRTRDGYETRFERLLKHPPQAVWDMLTTPGEVAKWFVRIELEPRVGGALVEHHDHAGMKITGKVTRFEPPSVFEHTWGDGLIRWELEPDAGGCRLVLTSVAKGKDNALGSTAGWHVCLDVLEDVLSGVDPKASAPPRVEEHDGKFVPTASGRGRWARLDGIAADYQGRIP